MQTIAVNIPCSHFWLEQNLQRSFSKSCSFSLAFLIKIVKKKLFLYGHMMIWFHTLVAKQYTSPKSCVCKLIWPLYPVSYECQSLRTCISCFIRGVTPRESWVLRQPRHSRGGRQHPKKKPAVRVYFPPASFVPYREKVGEVSPTAAYNFYILWRKKISPFDFHLNGVQLCLGVWWNIALTSYLMPVPL